MSSETRAAVLQSVRFKPEHLSSEFFYVALIGYVLFTRRVADMDEYALPVFLVLVAGYQLAGLILQIVRRRLPDVWDVLYWTGGTFIFSAGYVLAMYGLIAIAIDAWSLLNALRNTRDDGSLLLSVVGDPVKTKRASRFRVASPSRLA